MESPIAAPNRLRPACGTLCSISLGRGTMCRLLPVLPLIAFGRVYLEALRPTEVLGGWRSGDFSTAVTAAAARVMTAASAPGGATPGRPAVIKCHLGESRLLPHMWELPAGTWLVRRAEAADENKGVLWLTSS
ncbi:MAG: hypothetical protein H0T12_08120 [Actinobacteria bacterium]|nr:hypothetical protein [Actinomycetota bacterium]